MRGGLEPYGSLRAPELPKAPADALRYADHEVTANSVVVGHSMGGIVALRLALERPRPLRALVLTGCFFPPARNGRSLARSVADYGAHRVAFLRSIERGQGSGESSARALASLLRLAARRGGFGAMLDAVEAPVLVVHARDDHHVPVAFARAAVTARREWTLRILEEGGHHAHVNNPQGWLQVVMPWLDQLPPGSGQARSAVSS